MVHVGLSELKSLHSSLGGQLMLQKFEKYIFILIASIIFSQIPFKVAKDPVPCDVKYGRDAYTWKDSVRSYLPRLVNDIFAKYPKTDVNSPDGNNEFDVSESRIYENISKMFKDTTVTNQTIRKYDSSRRYEVCKEIVAKTWQDPGIHGADVTPASVGLCINMINYIVEEHNLLWTEEQQNKFHVFNADSDKCAQVSNRSQCEQKHNDENEMACRGDRAFFIGTSFSLTVFLLISLLMGHDLWIDLSDKEIAILKKFLPMQTKFKICDTCANKFLRGKFKDNCANTCKLLPKSVINNNKRIEYLKKPLQVGKLETGFLLHTVISTLILIVALSIFTFTVQYNYQGYECNYHRLQPEHYMTCRDNNKDIKLAATFIVWPLAVLLILSTIYKLIDGIPYESLLKALRNTSKNK